jgi:hypothetical protein
MVLNVFDFPSLFDPGSAFCFAGEPDWSIRKDQQWHQQDKPTTRDVKRI